MPFLATRALNFLEDYFLCIMIAPGHSLNIFKHLYFNPFNLIWKVIF